MSLILVAWSKSTVCGEDVVFLGIVEDWDGVFPPVPLLAAVEFLFPDVAFCANVDIVGKLSAIFILELSNC